MKSMELHTHETGTIPSGVGVVLSFCFLVTGIVTGETNMPFREILQDGAYICTMLVAIGTMFKINYKQAALNFWHYVKNLFA